MPSRLLERAGLRPAALLLLIAGAALAAGCASVTAPPPTASAAVVQDLRTSGIAPAALGSFVLAAGRPAAMDTAIGGLRGSSLAPTGGSFAAQLKNELQTQLQAAGLYDERSDAVISGQLTDSRVDAAIGTGTGRLAARFVVTRQGRVVFDQEVAVEDSWESSFMGPVAIPLAMNRYTALYPALVGKLVRDAAFRRAMAR